RARISPGARRVANSPGTLHAKRQTGNARPPADRICLPTAGRDGNSITVRGTFNETQEYRRLDVVARNGGSFVALKDVPGPCPGAGWQLLASQGKRGVAGERGGQVSLSRPARGCKGLGSNEWPSEIVLSGEFQGGLVPTPSFIQFSVKLPAL